MFNLNFIFGILGHMYYERMYYAIFTYYIFFVYPQYIAVDFVRIFKIKKAESLISN